MRHSQYLINSTPKSPSQPLSTFPSPPPIPISLLLLSLTDHLLSLSHHPQKNNQTHNLHWQPRDQDILADPQRLPLPIIAARDSATRHLIQEHNDIRCYENFRQVLE